MEQKKDKKIKTAEKETAAIKLPLFTLKDLATPAKINWCPGCGDFGILMGLKNAIVELGIPQHELFLISGIGCSSKTPYWVKLYGYNGLHGRALPFATGLKLANHKLTVIVVGGDGDGYAEGGNHFMHSCRRNINMTYIVFNNQVYGLTTGQVSPTSEKGFRTKATPDPVIEEPIHPIALAIASGATYVARGFAGDMQHLKKLIMDAVSHKGFAFIDVLQPCITFNHLNTFDYFKQRVYKLEDEQFDASNKIKAFEKAQEWGNKIPIGVFYKESKATYEEQVPALQKQVLVKQSLDVKTQMENVMKDFM
ncbi:2-oxoacid:ferredoxin oxidoreductase subunit beta [Candidatus Woesearchaeota archaeon]|nr:2-oxoacid:ferredoxin oxidoreductase subunit beta [Candidatus Woesearchaeota archaeon]